VKTRVAILAVAVVALWVTADGGAYSTSGRRWAAGTNILMHLGQGGAAGSLIDGSSDWNAVTEGALASWNANMSSVSFRVTRDSDAGALRNGINNVIWADDMYGEAFGDAVAVTITLSRSSGISEADVLFDRARSWNAYRGNTRSASGKALIDLRRVALHEFGHVLGLDHPDQHGETLPAIMNSRVSNIDALQADDISGVGAIYGAPVAAPPPPTNRLFPGARLLAGQSLLSPNGRYRLLYQTDGNLVVYDDGDRTALWSSLTGGTSVGQVLMQPDGNLVVYDARMTPVWNSGTAGRANARLDMQSDGNLVVYSPDGVALWSSR
jgi:hypothetical protein